MFTIIKTPSPSPSIPRKTRVKHPNAWHQWHESWVIHEGPTTIWQDNPKGAAIHPPFADDTLRPFLDCGGEGGKEEVLMGVLKSLVELIVDKKGLS